jgi:hypothetical protein
MDDNRHGMNGAGERAGSPSSWKRDLLRGLFYAILIIVSILFFSGTASRFIYVDF